MKTTLTVAVAATLLVLPFASGQQEEPAVPEETGEAEPPVFPAIESGAVTVTIRQGTVTLSGNVSTLLAREEMEAAFRSMAGVDFVQNEVRIDAGGRRDLAIRKDIESGLFFNPETRSFEVDVEVENGLANLRGVVESREEFQAAERVAKSVPGVKAVNNALVIRP